MSRFQELREEHAKQDESLVRIGGQLDKIKVIGESIGTELAHQDKIIDDVSSSADGVNNKLQAANKGITKLLKNTNSKWYWIVGGLVVIAVVLLVIVLVL